MTVFCVCAPGQSPLNKDGQAETKGLSPRASAADYQARAQAGAATIAAEFPGHGIPTEGGPLSTEEYVVVEIGLFGPAGTRVQLSTTDFTLRINGKKTPLASRPYGMVYESLKDPTWEPPTPTKSKGSLSTGGEEGGDSTPPPTPKMPMELVHAIQQRVQKAALPEGDRALPVAGLIFFPYRGQAKGIHSVQLMYAGPAGKATLDLQP